MTASLRCENRSSLPATALAALVLGLVLCPFIYLALYSAYEPFFFATLLPLLVSSGYVPLVTRIILEKNYDNIPAR